MEWLGNDFADLYDILKTQLLYNCYFENPMKISFWIIHVTPQWKSGFES